MPILLLLLFFALPAFAADCARFLHPDEMRLTRVLHEMYELKTRPTTPEALSRLEKLNDQAIDLVADRLDEIGIRYRVIGLDPEFTFQFRTEEQQREVDERIRQIEWQLQQTQVHSAQAISDLYAEMMARLEEIKKNAGHGTLMPLLQNDQSEDYLIAQPHIVIQADSNHPRLLRSVPDRFPEVNTYLSPQFKSQAPELLAAVHGQNLFYSLEQVFAPDFGADLTLEHEITHLEHDLRRDQGEELPYYIVVQAAKGQKIQYEKPQFYDTVMHFGELATWNQDMNALDGQRPFIPLHHYSDGKVYVQTSRETAYWHSANGLRILCETAERTVAALRRGIRRHPELFAFDREEGRNARVTYMWIENNVHVANVEITLVGLRSSAQDGFQALSDYLDKVAARIQLHKFNARLVLNRHAGGTGEPLWRELN